MNPTQLKIARVKEMLGAVSHARHAVHATRAPLAKAIRLARSGSARLQAASVKLGRVLDSEDLQWSPDFREITAWYYAESENLASLDRSLRQKLKKLERQSEAKDPSGKTAERRLEREKKAKRKQQKLIPALAKAKERFKQHLEKLNAEITTTSELEAVNAARNLDDFRLNMFIGTSKWPEKRREDFRVLSRDLAEVKRLQNEIGEP